MVDTNGKIAFKGHPANRKDLVADFNTLLEGKDLEGVEAPKAGGDEVGAEEGGDSVDLDRISAVMEEMNKFKETGK